MTIFIAILTDLRAAIAVRAARDRAMTAILVLIWGRLSRAAGRLERLYGLWLAGKVPAARTSGSRVGTSQVVTVPPRVPRGRGWLAIRVWEVRAFGSQLQHLLADPEFAAFLAAVPRAGRVLRPVMRMLMVDPLPAVLCAPVAAKVTGVVERKTEKRRAAVVPAWPRKGLPRLPKGAWFEPPGPRWGSGG